jgi:hypothetical protein
MKEQNKKNEMIEVGDTHTFRACSNSSNLARPLVQSVLTPRPNAFFLDEYLPLQTRPELVHCRCERSNTRNYARADQAHSNMGARR